MAITYLPSDGATGGDVVCGVVIPAGVCRTSRPLPPRLISSTSVPTSHSYHNHVRDWLSASCVTARQSGISDSAPVPVLPPWRVSLSIGRSVSSVVPLLIHLEHAPFRVAYSYPLCSKSKYDVIHKPEVIKRSPRRPMRTEPLPLVTRTKLVEDWARNSGDMRII